MPKSLLIPTETRILRWFGYITDEQGEFIRGLSPLHIQKRLDHLSYAQMVLRHTSAYDEMCGQSEKVASNMLEVPYGKNHLY
ncbi:MAG: DUF6482 family protein [Pseudoalteromonas prydzensis]